jgi:hypothetical protein
LVKSPWRVIWQATVGTTGAGNFAINVTHPGASLAVGECVFPVIAGLRCGTTDPVKVEVTASTANQVFVSGWIREAI